MERHWFGIPNPWDRYIGQTLGNGHYTLMSYHNLPNRDPSNVPPSYSFTLIGKDDDILQVNAYNILRLEQSISQRGAYPT